MQGTTTTPADASGRTSPGVSGTPAALAVIVLGAIAFLAAARVGFRSIVPTIGG